MMFEGPVRSKVTSSVISLSADAQQKAEGKVKGCCGNEQLTGVIISGSGLAVQKKVGQMKEKQTVGNGNKFTIREEGTETSDLRRFFFFFFRFKEPIFWDIFL